MARCNFCRRKFKNAQAVRGHLRTCEAYRAERSSEPRAAQPRAAQPRAAQPNAPEPYTRPADPIRDQVPLDPLARMTRLLETELRFRRIDAIQRKLGERNLNPLAELELLDRLQQELKRHR